MKSILITLFTVIAFPNAGLSQSFTAEYDHQAIVVTDLETSSWFYSRVLNLEEIESPFSKDSHRWFNLGNGTELHLSKGSLEEISFYKPVHFAIRVNDLDVFIEWVTDKDISFQNWPGELQATNTRPDNIRQIYLQDPDGYWIEVNGK